MAIHWQIKFHSLRADTQYTVNIYDSSFSGTPIQLKGGSQPFFTQEDENEDQFTQIRTQSGYLRIIDDGLDADGNAWDWKTLLPSTDTDRPVTLTNSGGTTLWQGFMQAQNFGGTLYGNPQEREFPIQCALTILEGTDINYQQTAIQNFAYLLNYILNSIPTITIDTIVVQGNTDAQQWLLKKIDWQNFIQEVEDGELAARYNLFQCLEDICRFWGWTARTFRRTLYLTCTDDASETGFLTMNRTQLTTMAGGAAAGTTGGAFTTIALSGDIFASVSNDDFRQRGPNKATVTANCNEANLKMMDAGSESLIKKMEDCGWGSSTLQPTDKYVRYTNDLPNLSFTDNTVVGAGRSGYGSFNIIEIKDSISDPNGMEMPVIRIKKTYNGDSVNAYASLETVYEHGLGYGYIALKGKVYRQGVEFKDYDEESTRLGHDIGRKTMYLRLGIGADRAHAIWYNGNTWSSSLASFMVNIGNADDVFRFKYGTSSLILVRNSITPPTGTTGRIFLDFLGSNDLDDIDGQKSFDITDFALTYSLESNRAVSLPDSLTRSNRKSSRKYISTNGNNVREEFNADCIYASDNNMNYGFGILMNADGTNLGKLTYNGGSTPEYAEQHLANRVSSYWATAKRRISTEVRYNATVQSFSMSSLTPQMMVTLDGTRLYPISFTHDWRDDVMKLTLLQM